jgi:hypothetical protein
MGRTHKQRKILDSKPVHEPEIVKAVCGRHGILSVTRKETLIRLIDTAVMLWFAQGDPLSIHLLIMSQYRCLEVLGEKKGLGPHSA